MGLKIFCCVVGVLVALISAQTSANAGRQTVTIHRDTWGVPHIYAGREESGYYGLGYVQAEDNLTAILGSIMWMQGRLAEIQGEQALTQDIENRRWQHLEAAEKGFANLSPQLQSNYRYFVQGINQYLLDHPEQAPLWAPTLRAEHFVALSRAISWAGYAGVEGPGECAQLPPAGNARDSRGASNGWVVAPSRTAQGATIVVADPHLEFASGAYYEYRMDAGSLKSAGFALGPLLWQAHNRSVAWALTTGNPDMWDCYQVAVQDEDPLVYLFDGTPTKIIVREELFKVLAGQEQTHRFEYTRHNGVLSPVVARDDRHVFAVSTSQMKDAGLWDEEIYQMNHASSVSQVREIMKLQGSFPQNVIVGDAGGNTFYARAGKTPRRPTGYDWSRPVPGNTAKTAWLGYYAFEELVQFENPVQHYIQNNNVAPDAMYPLINLKAENYPTTVFNDIPGRMTSRGLRILELLPSKKAITLEDVFAIAFDEKWTNTEAWQRALAEALERFPSMLTTPEAINMFEVIQGFDGVADKESTSALHFFYFRRGMSEVFSESGFESQKSLPWDEDTFSDTFCRAILERVENAARAMKQELGAVDVRLGDVFRVSRGGRSWPLGGETIDMAQVTGCVASVSVLCERTMRAFASAPATAGVGSSQRFAWRGSNAMRIVVFSDPIQSFSLHVYGQSDNPRSPHYDDQAELLSEKRMKPVWFERDQLEGHIESSLELEIQ